MNSFNCYIYFPLSEQWMDCRCRVRFGQPVAEVLAYLHVQVSPISCLVVGSILALLGKNTDTAIVGGRWMGVGGQHALYCELVQKSNTWMA